MDNMGKIEIGSPIWIEKQRAICDAATPGPWATSVSNEYPYDDIGSGLTGEHVALCGSKIENSRFIVAARTVLPAALDALESAYAEIARLTAERDAAVKDLQLIAEDEIPCVACQIYNPATMYENATCETCANKCEFVWSGLCALHGDEKGV